MERQRQYTEMINAQRARYAQEQALYNQQYPGGPSCQRRRYGPPAGDPYLYGPDYGAGAGYGYGYGPRRRGLGGGGGSALPLLGALAGGLLLGDIIGGF